MKNVLLLIALLMLLVVAVMREPLHDTADLIAGASTETYATQIDIIAGVSEGGYSQGSYPTGE